MEIDNFIWWIRSKLDPGERRSNPSPTYPPTHPMNLSRPLQPPQWDTQDNGVRDYDGSYCNLDTFMTS